jgi:hypothetical protein
MRSHESYAFNIDLSNSASYGPNRFSLVIRENPALKLRLLDFAASKIAGGTSIVWLTANEQNYTNFTVERSTDNGVTFNVLGGFQSSGQGVYSFVDKNPLAPADLYRLKLEDLNGTITYSKVVKLEYNGEINKLVKNLSIYPNPVSSLINLAINSNNSVSSDLPALQSLISNPGLVTASSVNTSSYEIKIIDIKGYVVKTVISQSANWQSDISGLIPGTYIIQVLNSSNKSLVGKTAFVKL